MHKLTAALSVLLVYQIANAQQVDRPAYKVGDTWEWSKVDNLTKRESERTRLTIVQVGDDIQLASSPDAAPTVSWNLDGQLTRQSQTGRKMSYKSPHFAWPLHVGKKWPVHADWVNSSGSTGRTKQDAEVVAYEEVVTQAGKFMSFKVEMKGNWNNYTSGSSGRQTQTIWFAPEAGTQVRESFDDGFSRHTTELVAYSRK